MLLMRWTLKPHCQFAVLASAQQLGVPCTSTAMQEIWFMSYHCIYQLFYVCRGMLLAAVSYLVVMMFIRIKMPGYLS